MALMISRLSAFASPGFNRDDFTDSGSASSDPPDSGNIDPNAQCLIAPDDTIRRLKAEARRDAGKRCKDYRFRCPAAECSSEFCTKEGRGKHVRNIHPQLRSENTQKASVDPAVQRYIGQSLDPEKPFQCVFPSCRKLYTRRHILAHHIKLKHSVSGPQYYFCPFPSCSRRYELHNSLLRHQRLEKHFTGDSPEDAEATADDSDGASDRELEEFIMQA